MTDDMLRYGRQVVSEADIEAVGRVLSSDWLTQGPTVEAFEEAIAEYVGARYAVAFSSGSAGLHGAAWASGLGQGDTVWASALTFMSTINAARHVGAKPGALDISLSDWNADLTTIPTNAAGVFPVHYAGLPQDLSTLPSEGFDGVVIEDAAHALGSRTPFGPVGNCAQSAMTCFSFHPVKPITTGEGGIVTTNDEQLAVALQEFRSHGIVRSPTKGEWVYEISALGFNYRMTDIQAALGLSQLQRLDTYIERRREIAERYRTELGGLPVTLPPSEGRGFRHGYHLFPVRLERRREAFKFFKDHNILLQVHYVPVHHHPISADLANFGVPLPNVDWLYEGLVSIPMHPGLTDQQVKHVIEVFHEFTDR